MDPRVLVTSRRGLLLGGVSAHAAGLFFELGGFDDRYQPAYYEDADYCVRLWKAGRRVVYDPRALVTHFEFASSTSSAAAMAMQLERRALFADLIVTGWRDRYRPSADGSCGPGIGTGQDNASL